MNTQNAKTSRGPYRKNKPYYDARSNAWRYSTPTGKITLCKQPIGVTIDKQNPPKEALDALNRIIREQRQPGQTPTESQHATPELSIRDWLTHWVTKANAGPTPPNTKKGRLIAVRHFGDFLETQSIVHVREIEDFHLKNFIAAMLERKPKPLAKSSIKQTLNYLGPIFKDKEYPKRTPYTKEVKKMCLPNSGTKKQKKYYTVAQARLVMDEIDRLIAEGKQEKWFVDIVGVMRTMGLRIQAACDLQKKWLKTTANGKYYLEVPNEFGYKGGGDYIISAFVLQLIQSSPTNRVFPVGTKQKTTYDRLKPIVRRVLGAENDVGSYNHVWRHTLGWNLRNTYGKSASTVQHVLAHKSSRTTEEYYAPEDIETTIREMEDFEGF